MALRYNITSSTISDGAGRVFREKFARGAFRDVIARLNGRVELLIDHDVRRRVALARVWDTAAGLEFEAVLDESMDGRIIEQAITRREVRGTSFSFRAGIGASQWLDEGRTRVVTQVAELYEISVLLTAQPAYSTSAPDTRTWQGRRALLRTRFLLSELGAVSFRNTRRRP